MSEQEQKQVSTNCRRSRQTKQNSTYITTLQHPANDDKEAWKAYWEAQGQSWRTEPEIDKERQQYLDECRSIKPDIEQGIYPFKNVKLSRADIEWLLATHENGRGPVDWSDEKQRKRIGLDLRGADLQKANLSDLPLARTIGGLDSRTYKEPREYFTAAAINLENTNLTRAHLEAARLHFAHLKDANLSHAYLGGANLDHANLEKAILFGTRLEKASLDSASLRSADLTVAHLEEASLTETHMEKAELISCYLEGAALLDAHLEGADLTDTFFDRKTSLYQTVV